MMNHRASKPGSKLTSAVVDGGSVRGEEGEPDRVVLTPRPTVRRRHHPAVVAVGVASAAAAGEDMRYALQTLIHSLTSHYRHVVAVEVGRH